MPRTVLVTGAAKFIGFHPAHRLLRQGEHVVGFDNLNDYYYVTMKEGRLRELKAYAGFTSVRADLVDAEAVSAVFRDSDIRKPRNTGPKRQKPRPFPAEAFVGPSGQ